MNPAQPLGGGEPAYAAGFSWRKRSFLRRFTGRTDIRPLRANRALPPDATLLIWGSTPVPEPLPPGARVVRVEDGFLRSVGLGADLVRPLSWVFDDQGIYYDATRPSALESLLQQGRFAPDELDRARLLRERIVAAGLTKYNLGGHPWTRPAGARQVVLAIGQVETDSSIAFGCADVRTNMGLLRAVREARPGAWLVYKPHPDVVAGLRGPGAGEADAASHCDQVVTGTSLHELLQQVDELHVLTSLAGFEGLLRGRPVVCWGRPFYAGWGLTDDRRPPERRTTRRTLDELVAAALIRYPVYLGAATGARCTPEQALEDLLAWRERAPAVDSWWRRLVRPYIARP
jgi:capsular polysaccharide export protein